jgi:2-oxoglutarate dehydrogenase E2 component (dihydrolipoamide succinyltransferase)
VVVIETEKATVELPAPVSGRVTKILKKKGEPAAVGEVIGYMEEADVVAEPKPPAPKPAPKKEAAAPAPSKTTEPVRVMPAAQRALDEKGLNAADVKATGPGGRLLKEDVLRQGEPAAKPSEPAPVQPGPPIADGPETHERTEEVVRMSPLRRHLAKRLVEAQQTAALLTTFNEIDMSGVLQLREKYGEAFLQKYSVKLGFMSFFVKASIDALKLVPQVNAEVRGDNIVYHNYCDIGIAVSSEKGLVVPVLRNADRMSFAEVETAIAGFGQRAKENKLAPGELQGGTFTISNGGIFGSLLSTPIINPPQSGILGMHAIQERPVAREGQVVIRPMMYVALTYDHRIVDGREAVTFLKRVKEVIEKPARMLMEI